MSPHDEDGQPPLIIVRRIKKVKGGHHGGAWKVAYADFITALMAFFLVMWLLGSATKQQLAAISAYFRNPSMTQGASTVAPPGAIGAGGSSTSLLKLDHTVSPSPSAKADNRSVLERKAAEQEAKRQERQRLEQLKQELQKAVDRSQALEPFKDQLLIDITPEGLRIQIVDKQNRPMFDLGKAQLKPYTVDILKELAGFINQVPNRISITGHTDDAPYSDDKGYSNWELSADRANAARRALLQGGMADTKIARVVGLAASVPLDKAHPGDAVNRRISIIVMTKQAERAATSQDSAAPDDATASSGSDERIRPIKLPFGNGSTP